MKIKVQDMMVNTFCFMVLFMVGSLFSACDKGKPETTEPPVFGEMGEPLQMEIYLWHERNMPATTSLQSVANSNNPDGADLSVASTDVELFKRSNLPPTYFLYGSQEVFRGQIEACANAVRQAGAPVESRMLDGLQHGFGGRGNWFEGFDKWMSEIFE
jgi:hypothetical protein